MMSAVVWLLLMSDAGHLPLTSVRDWAEASGHVPNGSVLPTLHEVEPNGQ
jgi:hypothetical protein